MKVHGMVDPGRFAVEKIPGTNRSLIRLFQNVELCKEAHFDGGQYDEYHFEGYQYDEYHVEVETWDGVIQNVRDNYEVFLKQGMENEVDRSNEALFKAQTATNTAVQDMDAMNVDQEYRLTLLELGLSETDI
ncbi:hypothetical protein D3Z52_23505 [Clostridiaceae bacterium]|jgi:hypothetical protein|nr:hypothetical protein [Clostridiaceae bacterium]NBH81029.1 hypothetical protein [Clostridiaceae bacterium]